MITLISPAKLMDETIRPIDIPCTQPQFLKDASSLVKQLKKCRPQELSKLMDLSEALAVQTAERFQQFSLPFTPQNAIPSVLLFQGDVYRGMQAGTFTKADLNFAQKHLRILSGLYGVLNPLDLIQPYRLMMGTPFAPSATVKNLYAFWGNKLADSISGEMKKNEVILNLASGEYFKALPKARLTHPVITCEFKEKKGNKLTVVSTYAKLARGLMAGYIVRQRIDQPEGLKLFSENGYGFSPSDSTADTWVFVRG